MERSNTIRLFILFEAATFVVACLIHFGLLVGGYEHRQARTAEGVIATVLFASAAFTWIGPEWTRKTGLVAQAFALVGTLIGLFTIVVGVGPRTAPDVVYHI